MSTTAVQLIHSCGHDAHHLVPQLNSAAARRLYDSIAEQQCPSCRGLTEPLKWEAPESAPQAQSPRRGRSRRQVKIRWGK